MKKHSSWNSLRKNYFAYFEEMFLAFFEEIFLEFCEEFFVVIIFLGLFQEFLAFYEDMIFSIL